MDKVYAKRMRHLGEIRHPDRSWWFDLWEPVRGHGLALTLHVEDMEDRTRFFRHAESVYPLFGATDLVEVLDLFGEGQEFRIEGGGE